MDQKQIEKQAQDIMDNFLAAMNSIEVEEDFVSIQDICYRIEGEGLETDLKFKELFLANAPKTKGDAIIANKGSWT